MARYRSEASPSELARLITDINDVLSGWDNPKLRALISHHLINVQPKQPAADWLRSALQAGSSEAHPVK